MPGQQHEVTVRFLARSPDVNFGGEVRSGRTARRVADQQRLHIEAQALLWRGGWLRAMVGRRAVS